MDKVSALNTVSGVVATVNKSDLSHPFFGKFLVEVEEGTKSFEPTKFKATTAEEFEARKDHKSEAVEPSKVEAHDAKREGSK